MKLLLRGRQMDASIGSDATVDGSFRRPPTPRHPFSSSLFQITNKFTLISQNYIQIYVILQSEPVYLKKTIVKYINNSMIKIHKSKF